MRIALLIYWFNHDTQENGYEWQTPSEKTISNHSTREKALTNRPDRYKCLNDEWREI